MRIAMPRTLPWPPVLATAIPWLLVVMAWAFLRDGFSPTTELEQFLGTEASLQFGVVLLGFWALSILSLIACVFYLFGHRKSIAAWLCTTLNAFVVIVPVVVMSWLHWGA